MFNIIYNNVRVVCKSEANREMLSAKNYCYEMNQSIICAVCAVLENSRFPMSIMANIVAVKKLYHCEMNYTCIKWKFSATKSQFAISAFESLELLTFVIYNSEFIDQFSFLLLIIDQK